ncbi:hypothetical protein EXIGLDRAFT_725946 [Exidia glandulosa HHB12029]|uniref:Uncharacterized protein n=1 Tax=Exidia glandulosa HHB12029 TaxID=1314781 RepID=A0A165DXG1_EXIGL|nr:hypothetical protein EXIGLDRAFT_725946 [Exidia glandulosa HHB12029]
MKLRHLELEAHALPTSSSAVLPNLRILTLTLPLSPHHMQHDAHPNVERINIRNLTHLASSMHHGTLLAQLSTFFCRSRFPRLRVIRVIQVGTETATIMRLFWTRFGDQLMREGVVLEDIFGAHVEGRVHTSRTW